VCFEQLAKKQQKPNKESETTEPHKSGVNFLKNISKKVMKDVTRLVVLFLGS